MAHRLKTLPARSEPNRPEPNRPEPARPAHSARPAPVAGRVAARVSGRAAARVVAVFGTRPEAIKIAPVIRALTTTDGIEPLVCVTGQHREMLDQAMDLFGLSPAVDLDVMRHAQGLTHVTTTVLAGLERAFARLRPDLVMVHGDTTTTLAASLAAFYARIPVAHVEAGLRTGNPMAPWPEETNRRLVGAIASLHFAPTRAAADNLRAENIAPEQIEITGNTAIDALAWVRSEILTRPGTAAEMQTRFPWLDPDRRLILVTGHRRENHGAGIAALARALARLARRGDVQIAYPVHLNPAVQEPVHRILGRARDVHLIGPQDYKPFAWLMTRATLIITDSGGIQEEAPALGKPVLVTREVTERPEAVAAGTVRLVGSDTDRIIAEATRLLDDARAYRAMAWAHNPYGDGKAAGRIARRLERELAARVAA